VFNEILAEFSSIQTLELKTEIDEKNDVAYIEITKDAQSFVTVKIQDSTAPEFDVQIGDVRAGCRV
jgi:hypothetical protein